MKKNSVVFLLIFYYAFSDVFASDNGRAQKTRNALFPIVAYCPAKFVGTKWIGYELTIDPIARILTHVFEIEEIRGLVIREIDGRRIRMDGIREIIRRDIIDRQEFQKILNRQREFQYRGDSFAYLPRKLVGEKWLGYQFEAGPQSKIITQCCRVEEIRGLVIREIDGRRVGMKGTREVIVTDVDLSSAEFRENYNKIRQRNIMYDPNRDG